MCLCHSGSLWNMKGNIPAARQAQGLGAVVATLSRCLDLDANGVLLDLRRAEEDRDRDAPAVTDGDDAAAGLVVEEMEEDEEEVPQRRNGKAVKVDTDISDLLPVSGV